MPGVGPDRKCYTITDSGVTCLERWLSGPEPPEPHLQPALYAKVVIALLSGRPAAAFLDAQRAAHLARMRELTQVELAPDADQDPSIEPLAEFVRRARVGEGVVWLGSPSVWRMARS